MRYRGIAISETKAEELKAKIAAMSDEQLDARVQEIYGMPDDACTDEINTELLMILI